MQTKSYCVAFICSALSFTSCSTHKKLEVNQGRIDALTEKNEKLSNQVEQLNAQMSRLSDQNNRTAAEYSKYRQQCEAIHDRYKTASDILDEQERILKQIEDKLQAALTDLENRGLSVYHKRGLVFVSMEDALLYKSGSSKMDKNGIDALSKIAEVMNDYPDVKVIVVGNTDDAKFKGSNDNWSLSTERANGVVRALRDVYNIDPARLTAAGRAKFDPVADNSTVEGKAKNRRTEIIFNPNLDKLWDSIE